VERFQTGCVGEVNIEDNNVWSVGRESCDGSGGGVSRPHRQFASAKCSLERVLNRWFVVDYEERWHGIPGWRRQSVNPVHPAWLSFKELAVQLSSVPKHMTTKARAPEHSQLLETAADNSPPSLRQQLIPRIGQGTNTASQERTESTFAVALMIWGQGIASWHRT
jgi:hypothetical protein